MEFIDQAVENIEEAREALQEADFSGISPTDILMGKFDPGPILQPFKDYAVAVEEGLTLALSEIERLNCKVVKLEGVPIEIPES